MSRAFVNEDHAASQAQPAFERPISDQPNYMTSSGRLQLQTRLAEVQALHAEQSALGDKADQQLLADLERDLRYYRARLQSARLVPPVTSVEKVQIGSWVSYAEEDGTEHSICLVGEDQADAAVGLINWASPLGRSLLGARVGDEVLWQRPAGEMSIEVLDIATCPAIL